MYVCISNTCEATICLVLHNFSRNNYCQDHLEPEWPEVHQVPELELEAAVSPGHWPCLALALAALLGHSCCCPFPLESSATAAPPFPFPLESSATAAPTVAPHFPFHLESSTTAAPCPFPLTFRARFCLPASLLADEFLVNTHSGKWAPACISFSTSHSSLSSAFCRKRRYGQ
jgi:hypothetical protein